MTTSLLAWTTVLAAAVAAALFGQAARSAAGTRRTPAVTRAGLLLSRGGPWASVLLAAVAGWASGAWLTAAVVALGLVVLTAVAGLVLAPL